MQHSENEIYVTMYIASRKSSDELKKNRQVKHQVDEAMNSLMHPVMRGEELARRLALPTNVPVKWNVQIMSREQGFHSHEGKIPVMVSVAGIPNIMEKLRGDVVEQVTNMLFHELRRDSKYAKELAKSLGYETDKPQQFHLYLPSQVKVRGPVQSGTFGDGDGDGDGGPSVWGQGGWSKGCSSWPW